MNRDLVDRIVAAVLYEGYILYPYRPSVKNRQRWTFGGLYPESYSQAQGGTDAWTMQTEGLVRGGQGTTLEASVRFLHLLERQIGELTTPPADGPADDRPAFRPVGALQIDGEHFHTWQEAVERTVGPETVALGELTCSPCEVSFQFPACREWKLLRQRTGEAIGIEVREQQAIAGTMALSAEQADDELFKMRVRILNRTPWGADAGSRRDEALLRSLVSTHTLLGVRGGAFVSLLDPPPDCQAIAASCRNEGTWPVLVGADGAKDTLLSSPIILYDYPQVAPESPGDLFDATEIDEILTLRILTLTEEEKQAMAAVDERGRALLQRTEALARDQMLGLHGTIRGLRTVTEEGHHD
jgi:hypothetical protein